VTDTSAPAPPPRIATLDLVRGVAVLGIVAINLPGFAGPAASTLSPHWPHPATWADEAVFAANFAALEGKMRALFSLLFGASMALLVERADQAGRDGRQWQARRLLWLLLFGWLHYILLWWGDILFTYALCGMLALLFFGMSPRRMAVVGLVGFVAWHALDATGGLPAILAEEAVRLHHATPAQAAATADFIRGTAERMGQDTAQAHMSFVAMASDKLLHAPFWQFDVFISCLGETLPLMLIGMALQRSGLFAGRWPQAWLWRMAGVGLGFGLPMALGLTAWLWARHFPIGAGSAIMTGPAGPEHLLMALGYLALLVLGSRALRATWLGQRLEAAGRMAFSNYLGTSLAMSVLFNGWGFGLFGQLGHAAQLPVLLGVWALMLAWSPWWLARFTQGPMEWLWRSATQGQWLALRRKP
jgi:uncharacterized protein